MSKTYEVFRARHGLPPERNTARLPVILPDRDELIERLNEAVRDRDAADKERDDALRLVAEVLAALDRVNRETYRRMRLTGVPQDVLDRLEAPAPWPTEQGRW